MREGEKRGTECLEREPGNEAEIMNEGSGEGTTLDRICI